MNIIDFLLGRKLAGNNVSGNWTFTNCESLFVNGARLELLNELMSRIPKITNADKMFSGAKFQEPTLLDQLPNDFLDNLRGCERCTDMFSNSNGFTEFPGISFNVPTRISNMFQANERLKTVGSFSAPDILELGSSGATFNYMCAYCPKLVSFGGITVNSDTPISVSGMFSQCLALTHVGPLNFKIKQIDYAFRLCKKLETIPTLFLLGQGVGGIQATQAFPTGNATERTALKSLTFHPDSSCKGISNFKISYCSFERDGMLALFNSLPDITGSTLASSYKSITITGNPCVTGKLSDGTACATLTPADKAIATNKGWSLVT